MKKYLVIIVTITVISGAQCGLIDGIFGAVKDTAHAIKEDVSGVVNYGKEAVFGVNKPADSSNINGTERSIANLGLVDKVSLKIHNIATGVREHFRSVIHIVDADENGRGLIGRMFDRVKNHAIKVKKFIIGDNTDQTNNQNGQNGLHRYPTHLTDKLKEYVCKNSSSSNQGIRKTLQSLRDAVEAMRRNMTKHKQKDEGTDGAGLIDIRMGRPDASSLNTYNNNIDQGLHAGYDKVEDQVNKAGENMKNSFDDFKRGSNSFIEEQRNSIQNNYNKLSNNANNINKNMEKSLTEIESRFRNTVDTNNV